MGEWVKHDGMGYPVSTGTTVDFKRRNGETGTATILGGADQDGKLDDKTLSPWFWGTRWNWVDPFGSRIVSYRLHTPEDTAREARQALFNRWAEGVSTNAPEDPKRVKTPVKEGAR